MNIVEAAAADNLDAVREGLKSLDPKNKTDQTLLDEALWAAVEASRVEAGKLLLAAGGRLDAQYEQPMHWAVRDERIDAIQTLRALGVDPNESSRNIRDGQTPLMCAMQISPKVTAPIEALIKAGADVNVTDVNGSTALTFAAENKHFAAMQLLIEAGADVNFRNVNRESALTIVVGNRSWRQREAAMELLRKVGADEKGVLERELDACVKGGNAEGLQKLLAQSPSPEDLSPALSSAVSRNRADMVAMLLDAGARPSTDGDTLINAIQRGTLEMVKLLVEAGADVSATSKFNEGQPALWWAKAMKRQDIVKYLSRLSATQPRANHYAGRYGIDTLETYRYMLFVEAPIDTAAGAINEVMDALAWEKDVLSKSVKVTQSAMAALQLAGHRWTALSPMTLTCGDLLKAAPEIARKSAARTLFLSSSDDPDFVHYALFSAERENLEEVECGTASYFRDPSSSPSQRMTRKRL